MAQRFAESLLYSEPCYMRGRNTGLVQPGKVCEYCGQTYLEVGSEPGLSGAYLRHPDAGEVTRQRPVERASVLRTREKGTLLLVEEKDAADRRALVLVNIAAGFRGSTGWSAAETAEEPCPRAGVRLHVLSSDVRAGGVCSWCGAALEELAGDCYYHPERGAFARYLPFPPNGITVLAEGYCAQGAAGRMGGHAVRLLIMEPGAVFRVVRYGRLYGAPATRYVYWDGENLRLGTRDEIFPPSCEVPEGEVI